MLVLVRLCGTADAVVSHKGLAHALPIKMILNRQLVAEILPHAQNHPSIHVRLVRLLGGCKQGFYTHI